MKHVSIEEFLATGLNVLLHVYLKFVTKTIIDNYNIFEIRKKAILR